MTDLPNTVFFYSNHRITAPKIGKYRIPSYRTPPPLLQGYDNLLVRCDSYEKVASIIERVSIRGRLLMEKIQYCKGSMLNWKICIVMINNGNKWYHNNFPHLDINECLIDDDLCDYLCINTQGSTDVHVMHTTASFLTRMEDRVDVQWGTSKRMENVVSEIFSYLLLLLIFFWSLSLFSKISSENI